MLSFNLPSEVDFEDEVLTITVQQQGERLKNLREQEPRKNYTPAAINIMLITKEGELVKARSGNSFALTLHNIDEVLHPGQYVVLVGPMWNESAENDPLYKELLIDVYSKYSLDIDPVRDYFGMSLLEKTLK